MLYLSWNELSGSSARDLSILGYWVASQHSHVSSEMLTDQNCNCNSADFSSAQLNFLGSQFLNESGFETRGMDVTIKK